MNRIAPALAALLVGAAGCGGGTDGTPATLPTAAAPAPPPIPTTVTVTPKAAEPMSPGATVQLAAEVRDQNGQVMTGVVVTWASGDERTAQVDKTGLVSGVSGGTATITAMAGEASGASEVMVIDMEWAAGFVARTHVVDGVMGLIVRVDPNCNAEDCERAWFPGDDSFVRWFRSWIRTRR